MSIRTATAAFGLLAALSIAVLLWVCFGTWSVPVRIGQAELQRHVEAILPIERQMGPVALRVETATLSLLPDGRIRVVAGIRGSTQGVGTTATTTAVAGVTYRDGGIYLSDPVVEGVEADALAHPAMHRISGLIGGTAVAATRSGVGKAAAPLLRDILMARPVYVLKQDNFRHMAVRAALERIEVRDGTLVAFLGSPLLRFGIGLVAAILGALGVLGAISLRSGSR